jgi:hypothetical protein
MFNPSRRSAGAKLGGAAGPDYSIGAAAPAAARLPGAAPRWYHPGLPHGLSLKENDGKSTGVPAF